MKDVPTNIQRKKISELKQSTLNVVKDVIHGSLLGKQLRKLYTNLQIPIVLLQIV